jgi:hypothetical protein
MDINHIKGVVARRAADHDSITVQVDGKVITGTCYHAGTIVFCVVTPHGPLYFNYEEVEAVS